MGEIRRLLSNRLVVSVSLAAVLLVLACAVLVLASLQAWPPGLFRFGAEDPALVIPEHADLAGRAGFDRDSYHVGETARYRIHLLWRNDVVDPDLETFRNGIGLFPFHRRDSRESRRDLPGNTGEYTLEYVLQAVDVAPSSSHLMSPPTVYYTRRQEGGEMQSFRISAPAVHVGAYYPVNAGAIPLLDLKGAIRDPARLRQGLMFAAGMLVLGLAFYLVWSYGRVRRSGTLTEPERLWNRFHGIDRAALDNRRRMIHAEGILTGLVQYRLGMHPEGFWAGEVPEDPYWREIVARSRELLSLAYLETEPGAGAVEEVESLLERAFTGVVEEERLKREQAPGFLARVASQPGIVPLAAILVLAGAAMLILAALPRAWVSNEIVEYNEMLELAREEAGLVAAYEAYTGLGTRAADARVRTAALYNAGTLASRPALAGLDRAQQDALLAVMFQEQRVYIDALLHSLRMEDPFLLVAMIRDSLRFVIQGEAALKAAVRLDPWDEGIRRNLELTLKRRQAYAETIQELMQEGEEDPGMGDVERQAIMDLEMLMQAQMPEEFSEREEGKDDKDYFILEGF